jgi:hypothetical protein
VFCASKSPLAPEKTNENFSFAASGGGRRPDLSGFSWRTFTSAKVTMIDLPKADWMRKGVFNSRAKSEQEISCKARLFQKNELDSATTTAGDVHAAAIKAVHSDKNFRRVDTIAILALQ